MREKILELLKKIYAVVIKFKFARKIKPYIRKKKRKKKLREHYAFLEEAFKNTENIKLEDAGLKELAPTEKEGDFALGFDFFGVLSKLEDMDYEEFCGALYGITDNDDIDFRLAIAAKEEVEKNPEAVACFEDRLKMKVLTPGDGYFYDNGRMKTAVFAIELERNEEFAGGDVTIDREIINRIAAAKNSGADYIIVYCLREGNPVLTLTPYERRIYSKLGNMGCNFIVGANEYGIHKGGNFKRISIGYTNAIASMGGITGSEYALDPAGKDAAVIFRNKLIYNKEEKNIIVNTGYIPLYIPKKEKPYKRVVRIDSHNSEHRENADIVAAITYIEDETDKIRDIRNILTINDICRILDVEMPKKYAILGNASVGKVCSRSFEVNSRDVFFFRQPFEDPNDKDIKPLEYRLRQVDKAISRGARFVFSYVDLDESIPHINVGDAREAHIKVCARLRENYEVRTIGITGSVGKTSTKDMLYNVMSQKYETHRNLRNSNTQVNIGLHIQDFRSRYEVFIQEIGGGRPGGASRHSRMIKPEATVITNIGLAHIGNYGTQEKLMESKLGIIEGMDSNGTIFLNGDDPLLKTAKVDADTVFYAVHNHEADYYADNIVEVGETTEFEIVHGDHRVAAKLNVLGEYNVLNAVCCYAIGKKFKLTDEEIVAGIAEFETSGIRQNVVSVGGHRLFVDCWNASPASVETSLSVMDSMETKGRKIAVIGDITGVGEIHEELHKDVGEIVLKHKPDMVVCYGEDAKFVYDVVKAGGMEAKSITSPRSLKSFLLEECTKDDLVLFKGSSKTLLAERIDEAYGTMLADQRYIDAIKFKEAKSEKVKYNVYPMYATVTGYSGNPDRLKIAKMLRGAPVYSIGEGAFADAEDLTKIFIPKGIRHIGAAAFSGCGALEKIELPDSVRYIADKAFEECRALTDINIHSNIIHIGEGAFRNCVTLEKLTIPESVGEIRDDAFDGCENLTIYCKQGSYAQKYCEENGVRYKTI